MLRYWSTGSEQCRNCFQKQIIECQRKLHSVLSIFFLWWSYDSGWNSLHSYTVRERESVADLFIYRCCIVMFLFHLFILAQSILFVRISVLEWVKMTSFQYCVIFLFLFALVNVLLFHLIFLTPPYSLLSCNWHMAILHKETHKVIKIWSFLYWVWQAFFLVLDCIGHIICYAPQCIPS